MEAFILLSLYQSIYLHNALKSQLKLILGFQTCFLVYVYNYIWIIQVGQIEEACIQGYGLFMM